jgi:hypothetical protein
MMPLMRMSRTAGRLVEHIHFDPLDVPSPPPGTPTEMDWPADELERQQMRDLVSDDVQHKRKQLSRDQQWDILSYSMLGWSQYRIASYMQLNCNAVHYTLANPEHPMPKKRNGHPLKLDETQVQFLIDWVCSLHEARWTPWIKSLKSSGLMLASPALHIIFASMDLVIVSHGKSPFFQKQTGYIDSSKFFLILKYNTLLI